MKFYNDFNDMYANSNSTPVFNKQFKEMGRIRRWDKLLPDLFSDSQTYATIMRGINGLMDNFENRGVGLNVLENYSYEDDEGLKNDYANWLNAIHSKALNDDYADSDTFRQMYGFTVSEALEPDFIDYNLQHLDTPVGQRKMERYINYARIYGNFPDAYDVPDDSILDYYAYLIVSADPNTQKYIDRMRGSFTAKAYELNFQALVDYLAKYADTYKALP